MVRKDGNGNGNGDGRPRIVLSGAGSAAFANGQSTTISFTVDRHLISSALPLGIRGLPQGVTASFAPSTLPASNNSSQSFSLTLTAAPNAPAVRTTVTVTVGSGQIAALKNVSLVVTSPFGFVTGAPIIPIDPANPSTETGPQETLAAFGTITVPLNYQITQGGVGTISSAITTALPAGVTAQINPATLNGPASTGFITVNLVLTAGGNITPSTSNVSLAVKVNGAVTSTFTFSLILVAPFVYSVSPSSGVVPLFGRPGTQVTITGGGFRPGTTVTFGADSPIAASSISADGTSLTVSVPPTAASGPLTVTSPSGTASGAPNFAVDNYRNTRGFSWVNNNAFQNLVGPVWSYADATALFGASQTINNILGVNVYGPFVNLFLSVADAMLDSDGQCFGMALSSLRFNSGQMSFNGFPQQPPGAEPAGPMGPDVWLLDGPSFGGGSNPSPMLATLVHQQHLAQLSQESIDNWLGFHATVFSASTLRNAISQAFTASGANGMGAMIALNPSLGEGHVVVAYEIVDTGGGNFDILVYNPNIQFQTGEDSDPSVRASQAAASVIHVMSNGSWVLAHSDQIFGQPGIPDWSGGIFGITVVPWNTIPPRPSFPWPEVISGVGLAPLVIWIVTGDATVTQVSDGQGHTLLSKGEWNVDPETMLPGVRPMPTLGGLGKTTVPAFVSNQAASLIHTINGKAGGAYSVQWLGNGHGATLTDIPSKSDAADTLELDQGSITFTPGANKAVTATLLGAGSKTRLPRTAILKTSASAGAPVNFSFNTDAETFNYVHEGEPADYAIELSSFDTQGKPVALVAPATSVAKGDTLTFKPDWTRLSEGIGTITLRTATGEITNRPLRPPLGPMKPVGPIKKPIGPIEPPKR